MSEALSRFAVVAAAGEIPLGEAALCAAAHLEHPTSVEEGLALLADLSDGVDEPTLEGVTRHLYQRIGFHGNRQQYYDPRNSLLPDVLRRRTGIPITLAVVFLEVARRQGLGPVGVGMPGHFLVGDGAVPARWLDPFEGVWLDVGGARSRFEAVNGAHTSFEASHLAALPDPWLLLRLLGNLSAIYRRRTDVHRLIRVLELRCAISVVPVQPAERAELASLLSSVGRYQEAAETVEAALDATGERDPRRRTQWEQAAQRWRSHLN